MPAPDALDGWPGVADHALGRLSPEHLSVGWYALLLVAVAVAVIAGRHFLARLLGPAPPPPSTASLSAEQVNQIKDVVARGVDAGIDGRFADMRARMDDLRERVGGLEEALGELRQESASALGELRRESASRHEQNIVRLTALEVGGRRGGAASWDGRERRRQAPVD